MFILIGIAILVIVGAFALALGGARHSVEVYKNGLPENSSSTREDGTVLTAAISSFSDASSSCASDSSSGGSSDSC